MVGHDIFSVLYVIIDQQIELYFGDDYDRILNHTRKFVKTNYQQLIIWGANKDQILDNEGGRRGLLRKALCYIIEEGDEGNGLRAYGKYLAHEYTSAYQRDHLRLDPFADSQRLDYLDALTYSMEDLMKEEVPPLSGGPSASREQLAPLDILVEGWGLDQDEYDLSTLLANNNYSLKDAGRVLEWDRPHVLRVYHRLRDRVTPKGADGDHRPALRPAVVNPPQR